MRRSEATGRFALSPDGWRLALALNSPYPGDPSSSVAVLDLRTGRHTELATRLPDDWIVSLAFTRNGTRIVGAAFNATHVWDVASGSMETYGIGRGTAIAGAVLDRRGLVLDARRDGSVSVWDSDGARRLGHRFRWTNSRHGCALNPCTVIDPEAP